jgi:hypothetical protein
MVAGAQPHKMRLHALIWLGFFTVGTYLFTGISYPRGGVVPQGDMRGYAGRLRNFLSIVKQSEKTTLTILHHLNKKFCKTITHPPIFSWKPLSPKTSKCSHKSLTFPIERFSITLNVSHR